MKIALVLLATTVTAFAETAPKADTTRFEITVTKKGFEPETLNVPANKPVTLVFTRKTQATCTKEIILKLADGKKIERALPLDTPVEIPVTFPKAGKLGYACGMDMNKGVIVVQ
jgi:plastocyanin domain-containing protein